jgi:hypothetical protein
LPLQLSDDVIWQANALAGIESRGRPMLSNVPTLHTIGVSSRLKLRIFARMRLYSRRH